MTEYEIELRELSEIVLKLTNSKEYLCSKFEDGLSLKIRENMFITEIQSYKEVVQLALRAKKFEIFQISPYTLSSLGFFSNFFVVGDVFNQIEAMGQWPKWWYTSWCSGLRRSTSDDDRLEPKNFIFLLFLFFNCFIIIHSVFR